MKKYTNLEFKIYTLETIDVMTASDAFGSSVNDNEFGNDGFIPF